MEYNSNRQTGYRFRTPGTLNRRRCKDESIVPKLALQRYDLEWIYESEGPKRTNQNLCLYFRSTAISELHQWVTMHADSRMDMLGTSRSERHLLSRSFRSKRVKR
jgi:hypothetical protein